MQALDSNQKVIFTNKNLFKDLFSQFFFINALFTSVNYHLRSFVYFMIQ